MIGEIPQELRDLPQWVCWHSGGDQKKPLEPGPSDVLSNASVRDPETWGYFDQAEQCVLDDRATGVGFVFTAGDEFAGLDLDGCVVEGQITPWAWRLIRLIDSYTEYSPSRKGVHIIVKGKFKGNPFRRVTWTAGTKGGPDYKAVEIDCEKRYYRFTGSVVPGTYPEIRDRGAWLSALLSRAGDKKPALAIAAEGFDTNRNDAFTALGGLIRQQAGIEYDAMFDVLWRVNETCNVPPAPEEEVRAVAMSVCRYAASKQKRQVAEGAPEFQVLTAKGDPACCVTNTKLVLAQLPRFAGLHFNEFDGYEYVAEGERLEDIHAVELTCAVEGALSLPWGRGGAMEALEWSARATPKHPLREWLSGLVWDGTPRLDTWLSRYVKRPEDTVAALTGRRFLLGAITRVFEPGCHMPHVLLLMGPQRSGKSILGRILGGNSYFTEIHGSLEDKDAALALRGKWFVELPEMSYQSRTNIERAKAFISSQVDEIRPPYGRKVVVWPRQCVLIGTTNENRPLRDQTGNSRFWPVSVPARCEIDGLMSEREQLIAEAVAAYKSGEKWHTTDESWSTALSERQESATQSDLWEDIILEYLNRTAPPRFTTRDLLIEAIGIVEPKDMTMQAAMRVGSCISKLSRLGKLPYIRKNVAFNDGRQWAYIRDPSAPAPAKPTLKAVF